MSLIDLFRPRPGAALRAADELETASIASVVLHMPTPRLRDIGSDDIRAMLRPAAPGGLDRQGAGDEVTILQIGLAPADIEIAGETFAARCDVRLTNRSSFAMRVEGGVDARGRVEPRQAVLLAA